jgi:hypothetical protein
MPAREIELGERRHLGRFRCGSQLLGQFQEIPLQMGVLDVAHQLHAIGRHAQAGKFVLSPHVLVGRRSTRQSKDLGFQLRTEAAAAHLDAAQRQAHNFQFEFPRFIRIRHRALP